MDNSSGIRFQARNQTSPAAPVLSGPLRTAGARQNDFAQNVRQAARQSGEEQTAVSAQPSETQPLTSRMPGAAGGETLGVTPLTPAELGIRRTAQELQTRQLVNTLSGRLASPVSMADYPHSVVTYAGQLASQTNNAAFAQPITPGRLPATRNPDIRTVKPIHPSEGGHHVEKD